jgi:ribosomal-protein-serine acetyltransferase
MKEAALAKNIVLRPLERTDAPAMQQLVQTNRAHLDHWLRWSSSLHSLAGFEAFIDMFARKLTDGDGFHCCIWMEGMLAGGVVCWYVHPQNRNAEIGYWLGEAFTGYGLATRAAAWAIAHLFAERGLNRVEMQCGVSNMKSRAVPERLGFTLEGIRRQSHWITDRFVDHAVYGLLANEWDAR